MVVQIDRMSHDSSTSRQTALVTGASRGIGYELARALARHGYDLVLVSRQAQTLHAHAAELRKEGAAVHVHALDLTGERAAAALFEAVTRSGVIVDVVVNNAGIGEWGAFAGSQVERNERMIDLNVRSVTGITREFLPGMIERGFGRIMNVASVASFQPGPLMAVYYATKAYVLSFSLAVAEEVQGSGVTVTALCPGPTRTDFHREAGMDMTSGGATAGMVSARRIARFGYRAMVRGKRVAVVGALFKTMIFFERLLPRNTVTRLVRRMQEKRRGE